MNPVNADEKELAKFSDLAHRWWDPNSEFKPLHDINPLRLAWIDQHASIHGKLVVDIGCGGGILSESMAATGAKVTGIDLSDKALSVAKLHLLESGHQLEYLKKSAEDLAEERCGSFDVVTCMEMLEHVPDPSSIVQACAKLVKPGGQVFLSTLNRNLKSYVLAILGAEYILNMLPRGTHDYARFLKPSELVRFLREYDLEPQELLGMSFNPFSRTYKLGKDTSVNYLIRAVKKN